MALVQATFSYGRDHELNRLIREQVPAGVALHDLRSDIDANRTWISLSGTEDDLVSQLDVICALCFDRIDLQRHAGAHPRTGALDIANFTGFSAQGVDDFGAKLAQTYAVPVYLAYANEEARTLRYRGFGGLIDRVLAPNHGPCFANEHLGVVDLDMRPFYLTVAASFEEEFAHFCLSRERDIAQRSEEGEDMFAEVRAFAYPTPSYGRSMLLIEFGNPDLAPPDPILEWLAGKAKTAGVPHKGFEAIGAVRRVDLLETRNVPIRPEQIIDLD